MGLMTNELNAQIRKDTKNYGYAVDQFMFRTDFPNLDYCNAQVEYRNGAEVYNLGIDAGKSVMIVGKTGCGKSTLGLQMAYSLMKKYEESTMFLFDFESSHTLARIKGLTGWSDEEVEAKVNLLQVNIYTESVLKLIKQVAAFKKEHEKELLVENKEGILDDKGKLKKILPPTIVFIDSIAAMKTKDYQEGDDMKGLTAGGRTAINNKELFIRMVQPCLDANIIIIAINHITQNISLGTPPTSSTRYLKNTEAVGGGSGIQYMCNLWLKVETGDKFDLEKNNRYGDVVGFRATVSIVKSRNSEGGKSTSFVFSQRDGFDRDLSLFEFLYDNGIVQGKGVGLYLPGLEDVKFRLSTIKSTLASNAAFRARFEELCEEYLKATVSVSSKIKLSQEEPVQEQEILLEQMNSEDLANLD